MRCYPRREQPAALGMLHEGRSDDDGTYQPTALPRSTGRRTAARPEQSIQRPHAHQRRQQGAGVDHRGRQEDGARLQDDRRVSLPADWARRADQFEGLDSVAARRRMVEMLGLWPECDYDMVATFYVDVTRLFRPAYDPSINTTTSPADFPAWVDDNYTVGGGVNFRKWFADQQSSAYKGRKACPWAQLGYSYDWHSEAPRQGISEYIATDKSVVLTKKVQGVWSFVKELRKR